MTIINKYLYNIIFWISRFVTMSIFSIWLIIVLNVKYVFHERFSKLFIFFIENFKDNYFFTNFINNICSPYIGETSSYDLEIYLFKMFCKNSQNIDLLLIALAITLILGIVIVKFINKEFKYLLTVSIISSVVYMTMYSIFELPIMLALTISTPIILLIIYLLNKICPIRKVIILIPIIGEICCIKNILKHISKNISDKTINVFLLLTVLIISNIMCFLFPYKTNKYFENRIMNNWTHSIRIYQDKMIISGNEEIIIIDKNKNYTSYKNDTFTYIGYFVIDEKRKKLYLCAWHDTKLSMVDIKTLDTINKIPAVERGCIHKRYCCDEKLSKLIIVPTSSEHFSIVYLDTYEVKIFKGLKEMVDSLIYNKYRNCFLISFHEENDFFQEIDIENKKMRKIKADKYQGYIAMSEKNKEIYVAFHQQGRIGVYDAETMKLKRKIKSNYTVKDITYDEELNILIAPSYFAGYVDIFLMDGSDKLIAREFVGYGLREGCFDPQKENLYVCSENGLYKKKIDIKKLIDANYNNK